MAHFKIKRVLTFGLALIASAASADTNINSSSIGEDARVYEITSTEPPATGPDIGPLESRLLAQSAAEMRVSAGDVELLRVAEGTPNRSPSAVRWSQQPAKMAGLPLLPSVNYSRMSAGFWVVIPKRPVPIASL